MDIEQALTAHAKADSPLAALVGTRIYPLFIPQEAPLPAIAYQRISGPRVHSHDGVDQFGRARVQLTCQALGYDEAKDCAHLVRQAFRGFSGQMGGPAGPQIHEIRIENEMDGYNDEGDRFTVRIDLIIIHVDSD